MMTISRVRIETLLAEKAMTKAELARRCGIAKQNVSVILKRGTCEPRTAGRIAIGLEVPIEAILGE
jgi:DNA-binding Xre family transcriptional regulator